MLIVLFPEGLKKSQHLIPQLRASDTLVLSADLPDFQTKARKLIFDFSKGKAATVKKEYRALMALHELLKLYEIYPKEAFIEAIKLIPAFSSQNLSAIEASECIEIQSI